MADSKKKIDTKGHIPTWLNNTGLSGNAAKSLSNRGNAIDAAVDAASEPSQKKQTRGQRWPWQSK